MLSDLNFHTILNDALQTIILKAPKIIFIIILIFLVRWLLRFFLRRLGVYIDKNIELLSDQRKAKTLTSLLFSIGMVTIYAVGAFTILSALSINITPILASVGIVGLAVGFGAQTLVKDVISGFFIILENQYSIGDFVAINAKNGTVEGLTLRCTRLRDFDGQVHYIPNGEIRLVSNQTRDFSRAIFNFDIPYEEDPDKIMDVLKEVAGGLASDSRYANMFVEPFTFEGVDSIGNSRFTVLVHTKTKPKDKFTIQREYQRRIKKRFTELGISTPRQESSVWLMNEQMAGAR